MSQEVLILAVIPLILLELALLVWALVDLVRRERVRGGNKVVWALIVILVSTIGPIIYLVWGRQEPDPDVRDSGDQHHQA